VYTWKTEFRQMNLPGRAAPESRRPTPRTRPTCLCTTTLPPAGRRCGCPEGQTGTLSSHRVQGQGHGQGGLVNNLGDRSHSWGY